MRYAVQHYAATRPWAKKIGQVYAQAAQAQEARAQMKDVVRRELERVAQAFRVDKDVIVAELALAEAYGHFVAASRVIAHLETGLAEALRHTRLPSQLPDTLSLPAEAFYLHVEGLGGAFVAHRAERRDLLLTLVGAQFSAGSGLQGGAAQALRVAYPGELSPQLEGVGEAWQDLLVAVLGGLALMTQPRVMLSREWQQDAAAELRAQAMDPACARTRQKARSALLKAGYCEVTFCRMPDWTAPAAGYASQGYWRRQACGADKSGSRLVWVAPR